jgi:hypothetical protein
MAAFAPNAFAGAVNFGGEELKLGVEYHAEFSYKDNGLMEADKGDEQTKTTNIGLSEANLTLVGKLSKDVTLDMNWSAARASGNWFLVDYQAMDALMVRVGQDAANIGGWENENDLYDIFAKSIYNTNFRPWGASGFIEVQYDLGSAGKVGLQFLNDVVGDAASLRFNNASKQPTGILEYRGNFGMVSPLVQVGTYDANHSMVYSLGVNLKVADLDAYIDYTADNMALRETLGSSKEVITAHTSLVADLRYTLNQVQYFLKYSMYDQKQEPTDIKVNAKAGEFSDNGSRWAVGARCNWVTAYNPYLALQSSSGKWTNPKDSKEKSYSEMDILFGVMGKI